MRAAIRDDRLEMAAGVPAGRSATAGSVPMEGMGALGDRTVFTVVDVASTTSAQATIVSIGTAATGRIQVRTGGEGSALFEARFDLVDGSTNVTINRPGRAPGVRRIVWAQTAQGMTRCQMGVNLGGLSSAALTPGSGMSDAPGLNLAAAVSSQTPRFAVCYRGSLAADARAAVIRWLARRFDVSL
jgi:hypothetical protein